MGKKNKKKKANREKRHNNDVNHNQGKSLQNNTNNKIDHKQIALDKQKEYEKQLKLIKEIHPESLDTEKVPFGRPVSFCFDRLTF